MSAIIRINKLTVVNSTLVIKYKKYYYLLLIIPLLICGSFTELRSCIGFHFLNWLSIPEKYQKTVVKFMKIKCSILTTVWFLKEIQRLLTMKIIDVLLRILKKLMHFFSSNRINL
jgi:hypothetical protein